MVLPYSDKIGSDGLNTNENFENWLMAGLKAFTKYTGADRLDAKVINERSWSYNHNIAPFSSVHRFKKDLFAKFGFEL